MTSCNKEAEVKINYQHKYDSLLTLNRRLIYQVDSLKLYSSFQESQAKLLQGERKTTYYNQPARSNPQLRAWWDEYLRTRTRLDTLQF